MVRVKICGITRPQDARHAARCGADAIGLVFAKSSRKVSAAEAKKIAAALPETVAAVGVFVDEPVTRILRIAEQSGLSIIQLHGDEKESAVKKLQQNGYRVLKAFRVKARKDFSPALDSSADAVLFDASVPGRRGGTGRTFDWDLLKSVRLEKPWFVSGGLDPKNLKKLLKTVSPYGVDVSSGVESAPGIKSAELVKEFIQHAKSAR